MGFFLIALRFKFFESLSVVKDTFLIFNHATMTCYSISQQLLLLFISCFSSQCWPLKALLPHRFPPFTPTHTLMTVTISQDDSRSSGALIIHTSVEDQFQFWVQYLLSCTGFGGYKDADTHMVVLYQYHFNLKVSRQLEI